MTPTEYANKLIRLASTIERLGVVPISAGVEATGDTFALLRKRDFMAIRLDARYEDVGRVRHYLSVVDGVGFMANESFKSDGMQPMKAGAK